MGWLRVWSFITLLSLTWLPAVAAEKPDPQFLHFGNMGGLMPSLNVSDLPDAGSDGAALLSRYCTQCHNMPGPGMRTQKQWARIFWDMYWRMHLMNAQFEHFNVLKYDEGQLLFQYLMRHALKSVRVSSVVKGTPGAAEFVQTCMQCHELPDPTQHTPDEWPLVIQRMKRHMGSMGKLVPDPEQEQGIIGYLQSH